MQETMWLWHNHRPSDLFSLFTRRQAKLRRLRVPKDHNHRVAQAVRPFTKVSSRGRGREKGRLTGDAASTLSTLLLLCPIIAPSRAPCCAVRNMGAALETGNDESRSLGVSRRDDHGGCNVHTQPTARLGKWVVDATSRILLFACTMGQLGERFSFRKQPEQKECGAWTGNGGKWWCCVHARSSLPFGAHISRSAGSRRCGAARSECTGPRY
jgi:hypothetical protein